MSVQGLHDTIPAAARSNLHISVDAGALGAANGIGRYLTALLPRLASLADDWRWTLHARQSDTVEHARPSSWRVRGDGLPAGLGRVASLASSQPWWLHLDRPDVFWGPAHRLPLWLPRTTARVVTIHDLCWLRAPRTMRRSTRWLDRMLMPRALSQADRIIAVSRSTGEDLAATFPSLAQRLRVVHEAASPLPPAGTRDSLRELGLDSRYILCVGTLEPRKNHMRLLQAYAPLAQQAQLVFAGGRGWGRPELLQEARRLGIAERVLQLDALDDRRLATLYRHAEFLAMPSLYEGFGLPLLEALAQGTPVLFGDNSSMPEVAGDAGIAVDACDVASIRHGLTRMLGDDSLRSTLRSRASVQASAFSWDRAARETLAVFAEAAQARAAR